MPIRASQKALYPKDWRAISRRIRFERAGARCEWTEATVRCAALHGLPHPETGSMVVLTVAHLGSPMLMPFDLHVTRTTKTDQIFDLVGFGVSLPTEGLEGHEMVYARALAEFFGCAATSGAGFLVALPHGATDVSPTRPAVGLMAAAPIWILLTSWRLSRKPCETALIPAEPPTGSNEPPAALIGPPASFAGQNPEAALASAAQFREAWAGASSLVLGGLTDRQREDCGANNAALFSFTATGRAADPRELVTDAALTQFGRSALGGAGLTFGSLRGYREAIFADNAPVLGGAESRARHAAIILRVDQKMNPADCRDANLMAMCQLHHLRYDARHHAMTAAQTRRARKAAGDLFPQARRP